MFTKCIVSMIAVCLVGSVGVAQVDTKPDQVFSGPQVGEVLPNFKLKIGLGEKAGSEIDVIEQANGQPVVLIFVHKRTRPAFGLANAVMKYCNQDGGDNLHRCICFLSGDPSETATWMQRVKRIFPENTPVGYSTEGIEGPGSYGLNRNVELTVLVGKSNQVTANFALVQPGAHADGPKILSAIAATTGNKAKININKYLPSNQALQDAPIAIDPELRKLIRAVNAKDATEDAVGESLAEIEKMIKGNEPLQKQLGSILARWVNTKQIDRIGNKDQQAKLNAWAKRFSPKMNRTRKASDRMAPDRRAPDPVFTGLLRSVIQKSNTDEQVDAAVEAVDKYVAEHPVAAKELARISNTVVNSDRLSNYGTPYAQEKLKSWAQKFSKE